MSKLPSDIAELLDEAIDAEAEVSESAARQIFDRLDNLPKRYRRIATDSAPPDGLVIVSIGWEPMLRPPADPTANVSWTELCGQDVRLQTNGEGPYPVAEAFAQAHILADRLGAEVVVSIRSISHWRDAWGTLIEEDDV